MKYFKKNQTAILTTFTSIFSIILAIFSNALYDYILDTLQNTPKWLFAIFIIIDILIIYKASQLIHIVKDKLFSNSSDNLYVQQAFISMKSLANAQGEKLQNHLESTQMSSSLLVKICHENIKNIVNQCFEFFDSTFSTPGELVKTVNFEVTFMTKSYKDNKITIPAACNREHTQPSSMLQREQNPRIYDNTVTAEVYKEYESNQKPQIHIISDTSTPHISNGEKEYHFIYAGQGERIKSSIVLPIISHKNELLGTLVVHCDKPNFFKHKRKKFWKELLDIFSVEIGKEKIYLDILMKDQKLEKPF